MSQLSVGFISAGWIVEHVYLPFFAGHAQVENLFAYDPNPDRVEMLAIRSPGLRPVRDLQLICGPGGPDLVVVASPNHLHAEHVLRALKGGHNVICEKPICVTAQEARRIEETLTRSRAAVHPSLANRFRPDIARLRGVIRSGALGPIRHVSARWLRRSGIPGTGWHMRRAQSGGGVLMDLGPHLIDAVLWVCNYPDVGVLDCVLSDRYLGDPDRVAQWYGGAPTATDAPVDVEDTALLKLEIGMATCDIEIAWAGPYPHDTTDIEVVGEAGTAKLSTLFGFSQDTPLRQSTLQIFDARGLRSEAFDLDPRQAPFFNMLSAITESATAGGEPPLDVQDALRVAHIIDVAYRRHRTPSRDRTAPKIACRRQRTRHRMVD